MSVTYGAVLEVSQETAGFLSALLHAERVRRGTRTGTRARSTFKQAILVLRWLFDDLQMTALARDNAISLSTGYDYLHEGIAVLAARRPDLRPGPDTGVDAWWSGKHKHHGGNIQVVSAPDGWPLWTSDVRPRREHDTTAARADPVLLQRLRDWVDDGGHALADLGYEAEANLLRIPSKKSTGAELTVDQQAYNAVPKPCDATSDAPGGSATSSRPRSSFRTADTRTT